MQASAHPTLIVINKLFEALINKNFVDHINRVDLLSDKYNGIRSALSAADNITSITNRISKVQAKDPTQGRSHKIFQSLFAMCGIMVYFTSSLIFGIPMEVFSQLSSHS